jgi:hypothetical protein
VTATMRRKLSTSLQGERPEVEHVASWTIQDGINDSEMLAVVGDLLKRHDILILDNASIHRFLENVGLDDCGCGT